MFMAYWLLIALRYMIKAYSSVFIDCKGFKSCFILFLVFWSQLNVCDRYDCSHHLDHPEKNNKISVRKVRTNIRGVFLMSPLVHLSMHI